MPITLPSGLAELLGQIQTGARTGFQRSHSYGIAFARRLKWLEDSLGFDVDADFNLKPRPETKRGSATLGVAAHNGNHVDLIDELKYDASDPESRKFMNVIERRQRTEIGDADDRGASMGEIEAIRAKYRVELMNAADFWQTLELYQENLDKLGFDDLRSVAFNRADPRTLGDLDALKTYLDQSQMRRLFDYDYMKAHPFFQEIEALRGGAEIDIDNALIDRYNVQSLIRYPNGQTLWNSDTRADALVRNTIWKDYANADGTIGNNAFAEFEARTQSSEFRDLVNKTARLIDDLPGDVKPASLAELERSYLRTYRNDASRMAIFGTYSDVRARSILASIEVAGDRVPDFVRNGLKKAVDYHRNGDGTFSGSRVGVSLAAGVLAVGNLWVEWERHQNDGGDFESFVKEQGNLFLSGLPIAGAIGAAMLTPAGPAVLFAATAVGTFAGIKNIVDYLTSDEYGLDKDGATYQFLKPIDDALDRFEETITRGLEGIASSIGAIVANPGDFVEFVLEKVIARSIQWSGGEDVDAWSRRAAASNDNECAWSGRPSRYAREAA